MPGPLFYVPSLVGNRLQKLRDVGLDFLAVDRPDVHNARPVAFSDITANGPDGGQGVIYTIEHPTGEFTPTKNLLLLEWQPAAPDQEKSLAAGRFWLGRVKGQPVEPASLARPNLHDSEVVTMADGQEWHIPIAKKMPMNHGLDANGNFSRVPKPQHVTYFEQCERFFNHFMVAADDDKGTITIRDGNAFVAGALALNYLVNRDVIAWLGLLDDANLFQAISATWEGNAMRRAFLQKKTEESAATLAT